MIDYTYVTDPVDINIEQIMSSPYIGLDVETTGLNPKEHTLLTVQIATVNQVFVFDARRLDLQPLFDALKHYQGLVIIQNAKFDLQYVYHDYGFWWDAKFYDPYIAHRLKNTGKSRTYLEKFVGLERLCAGYLGRKLNKEVRYSFQHTVGELTEAQLDYAAEDAYVLIPLWQKMKSRVLKRQPQRILDLEFSELPVTASLEYNGIHVNRTLWTDVADEKLEQRGDTAEKIKFLMSDYIDWDINLNSWQQLLKVFKAMGFGDIKNTQALTIERNRHRHPVFAELSKYKKLQKACSTYGHAWLRHVQEDGKVYADFNQLGTDTGRYSCSNPPLQTIPVREDSRYRQAFVAPEGEVMVTGDLSQIEYRLAGVASGEQVIIDEYNKEDPDFHQLAATLAINHLGREVDRFTGKTMNYALIFQGGQYKLAEVLGITKKESKELYYAYWAGYPKLQRYIRRKGYDALVQGHAETFWGRRRYFVVTEYGRKRKAVEARIQREGGNHPIQGTAADLLKRAMVLMFWPLCDLGAKMVHTVHDEVVVQVKAELANEVASIVNNAMCSAGAEIQTVVPTKANIKVSPTWVK